MNFGLIGNLIRKKYINTSQHNKVFRKNHNKSAHIKIIEITGISHYIKELTDFIFTLFLITNIFSFVVTIIIISVLYALETYVRNTGNPRNTTVHYLYKSNKHILVSYMNSTDDLTYST